MELDESRRCTATAKGTGERCKNVAMPGYTVCRVHGAGSRGKPGGRPIVHGRYSKYLPERLLDAYQEALADPRLLELGDEIALLGAREIELVNRLKSGESMGRWQAAQLVYGDLTQGIRTNNKELARTSLAQLGDVLFAGLGDEQGWREIAELVDRRRRLVESERKRLVEMQQTITAERAMILMAAILDVIRRNVPDPQTVAAISADLRALTVVGS